MNEDILNQAIRLFNIPDQPLHPLRGGNVSKVYAFRDGQKDCILRLTPPNAGIDQTLLLSNLALMDHLASGGVSVPAPLHSLRGALVEPIPAEGGNWLATAFERAPGTLAEELPYSIWTARRFQLMGSTVGRFHLCARSYISPDAGLERPRWDQAGNCFQPAEVIEDALLRARCAEALQAVQALPWDTAACGLIHTDLHGGNFMLDAEQESITLLDFDDAAYGWYAMDIAMCLHDFSVLSPDENKERFAAEFLLAFLRGYLPAYPLAAIWIERLPLFLKLLETGIYSQVAGFDCSADPEGWVARFMKGRAERMAQARPVFAIEFTGIDRAARAEMHG
jgi:Ser/Thr protein kinase RdoA (MazF antagonist)